MNTVFLIVVVESSMEGDVESATRNFNDSTAGLGGPSVVGIGIQGEHP